MNREEQKAHALKMSKFQAATLVTQLERACVGEAIMTQRLLRAYLEEYAALADAEQVDHALETLKSRVVAASDINAREEVLSALDAFEEKFGAGAATEARRLYAMCWTPRPGAVAEAR